MPANVILLVLLRYAACAVLRCWDTSQDSHHHLDTSRTESGHLICANRRGLLHQRFICERDVVRVQAFFMFLYEPLDPDGVPV
jgi:hypothetical protein